MPSGPVLLVSFNFCKIPAEIKRFSCPAEALILQNIQVDAKISAEDLFH